MKKIEGIKISIIAGPYMDNMTDPEGPAHIMPEFLEIAEITLTDLNKDISTLPGAHLPGWVNEVRLAAEFLAQKIHKNYERSLQNGNHRRNHRKNRLTKDIF